MSPRRATAAPAGTSRSHRRAGDASPPGLALAGGCAGQCRANSAISIRRGWALETDRGAIRVWDYAYVVDGVTWHKRHYAVALGAGDALLIAAQAPAAVADRMFEGADVVAATASPVG